ILKRYQEDKYGLNYKTLKLPVETRWGSSANCLNSIKVNQLAISLATTELINNSTTIINSEIIEIVQNNEFWNEVQNLLVILKILVSGITIFESDISYLSQFYKWYENLETNEYEFWENLFENNENNLDLIDDLEEEIEELNINYDENQNSDNQYSDDLYSDDLYSDDLYNKYQDIEDQNIEE
ncbi:4515_t:CDS:2, partial [Dentiscutata heterogama]